MKNESREKEMKIVLKPKEEMLKFFHNEKCKFNEIYISPLRMLRSKMSNGECVGKRTLSNTLMGHADVFIASTSLERIWLYSSNF